VTDRQLQEARRYAHGIVQYARGMCVDEEPHPVIEAKLAEAVERIKDVEDERDALVARVEQAEAREAALREALRPFVSHPRNLSIGSIDNVVEVRVTADQFAAALAALAAPSTGETTE